MPGRPIMGMLWLGLFLAGCSDPGSLSAPPLPPPEPTEPGLPSTSILPDALDPALTAHLSKRWETKYFIFHMDPSDSVEADRMEVFQAWAVSYLGINPVKKVDYFKFPSREALKAALGVGVGGVAFPGDQALATHHPWHNHEAFHLYLHLFRGGRETSRFFDEGMVVAHEFDPLNQDWGPRNTRRDPPFAHLERVLEFRRSGNLYALETILESAEFNRVAWDQPLPVLYSQAGIFVTYLRQRFGLEKMREIMVAISYDARLSTIRSTFLQVFGISIQEAETDWLAWLDAKLPGKP